MTKSMKTDETARPAPALSAEDGAQVKPTVESTTTGSAGEVSPKTATPVNPAQESANEGIHLRVMKAVKSGETCRLKLDLIRTDLGTQARVGKLKQAGVNDYAKKMQAHSDSSDEPGLHPVMVIHVMPEDLYPLADGHYRVAAAKKNAFKEIEAIVVEGTLLEAIEMAIRSNHDHGVQRTPADVDNAIKMALERFGDRTDRYLAEMVGVSPTTISSHRKKGSSGIFREILIEPNRA